MGLNLAEIQQKLDRLIQNMSEQNRRAYQIFYDPNPQDVTLPQLDENGNLVNVTIPNRAKIKQQMWDDVNAAVGLWHRTFYVNADGNDNNPGTSDAPFATLSKALASIPSGGWAQIFLQGDIEYSSNTTEYTVTNNNITAVIRRDPSLTTNPKVLFTDQKWLLLRGSNNRLWFQYIDFEFNLSGFTNPVSLFSWNTAVYAGEASFSVGGGIGWWSCNIDINVDFDKTVLLSNSIPFIRLTNTKVTYNNSTGNDYFAITDAHTAIKLTLESGSSISVNNTDITNASDIASHILNIVRDANGTPRNILCNFAL